MLVVISPAKTLDFESPAPAKGYTDPVLIEDAKRVMDALKKKSVKKLMDMQGISKNLAELNHERNQVWTVANDQENSKTAIHAFQGDVYIGLNAGDLNNDDLQFANDHLRILSGLYGILKPLDRIQPYRLEMGTSLKTTRGKNLYEFWKMRITDEVKSSLQPSEVLVNLASDEYFKSIKVNKLPNRVIQPVFMDKKNGKYKVLSFFAKKARGMMARYVIKNKLTEVEHLKSFADEGYLFNEELSSENKWVFARDQE